MGVAFREAVCGALGPLSVEAPSGAVIGLIGEDASSIRTVLKLAAGSQPPSGGEVDATEPRRLLGPADALNLAPAGVVALEHTLAMQDAMVRARARIGIERLRKSGATILFWSQEPELLRSLCDELWWIHQGRLIARGAPSDVLEAYQRHISIGLRHWAAGLQQPLESSMRRGDGRAEVVSVQTVDAEGKPAMIWASGEDVGVRVSVRYAEAVADPVVGIMIRTRIGFEVFGTNTELERETLGPVRGGETLQVTFWFRCQLCPQEYTVTAASHDPDGVWHDWIEDAVAFSVTDSRYTAGVVNLKATVQVERRDAP